MLSTLFSITELDYVFCSILPVSGIPCLTGLMALMATTALTQMITQRRPLNVEEVEGGEGGVVPRLLVGVEVEGGEKGKSTRGTSKKKTSGGTAEEMSLDSLVFPGTHLAFPLFCTASDGKVGWVLGTRL